MTSEASVDGIIAASKYGRCFFVDVLSSICFQSRSLDLELPDETFRGFLALRSSAVNAGQFCAPLPAKRIFQCGECLGT